MMLHLFFVLTFITNAFASETIPRYDVVETLLLSTRDATINKNGVPCVCCNSFHGVAYLGYFKGYCLSSKVLYFVQISLT